MNYQSRDHQSAQSTTNTADSLDDSLVGDDFYAVLNIIEQDEEVEEHVTVSVDVVS